MNRIIQYIPYWLAWPVSLLSTVAAVAGAAFVFYGAGFGDGELEPFVRAAIAFAASGVLWFFADMASSNRPL